MSNLGFQTIYRHLNARPDVVCERVFLPDPADITEMQRTQAPPFSLESQRPLTDFHMIGFSVTYEGDYINVVRLLDLAGIPVPGGRPPVPRPAGAHGWRLRLLQPGAGGALHGLHRGGRGRGAGRRADRGLPRAVPRSRELPGPAPVGPRRVRAGALRDPPRRRRHPGRGDGGAGRAAHRDQAPAARRQRVPDDCRREDAQRRVRPHGAARGRQGVWPRLSVLPGGPGVPARAPPQRGRPAPDHRAAGRRGREADRAGGRLRVGLPVDRRSPEDRRGQRHGAIDLLAASRQPHRGAGRLAGPRRAPHAHDRARGRHRAVAPRHPQGDHRRADPGRLRSRAGPGHSRISRRTS